MKTEVFDILMYIFETYLDDIDKEIPSEKLIRDELASIGFHDEKVTKAFNWLDDLSILKDNTSHKDTLENNGFRIFNALEIEKFDQQAQGVLLDLVALNVMSPGQRELIIDKALALDIARINEEQMKWVILMTLLNLPDTQGPLSWLQDMLYEDTPIIH